MFLVLQVLPRNIYYSQEKLRLLLSYLILKLESQTFSGYLLNSFNQNIFFYYFSV